MIILLLASLATFARTQASGPRWVEVMRTADSTIYVDSATIKRTGKDMLEVWSKKTYEHPKHYRDSETYDRLMSRLRINCATSRMMVLESTSYLGEVLVRRGHSSASSRTWSPRFPGSDWEALIAGACNIAAGKLPHGRP